MKSFIDRKDAGMELGKMLKPDYENSNALVIGIPRGGVIVGYEVALAINGELSTLITKKLPHPENPELAIGAASEDGSVYLTPVGKTLAKDTLREIISIQTEEIESRIHRFRQGKPLPDIAHRVVILVDDGIATGSTILPAIEFIRRRSASRIIVATPVAGRNFSPEITRQADEILILEQPDDFYAVGQVYEDFHPLSDEEVIALLSND